jgi:hypothetical protein
MSADSNAFDPYRSPSLPEGPYAGRSASNRPGWLTALCVVCVVLGALGLMNALMGTAGALAGPYLQALIQPKPSPSMPPEMQQAQQDLQDELQAVQDRYFVPLVAWIALRFIAALLLLIGGLQCLSLRESGRKLLIAACAVAIGFELSHAILQSIVNMENLAAFNSFGDTFLQSMPEGSQASPGMQNAMRSLLRGTIIAGLVVFYLLVLLKVGLYLFGMIYLQKLHIRALFKEGSGFGVQGSGKTIAS